MRRFNQRLQYSTLFGHEKGAYTGAEKRKLGVFELAHNGTLFLDELGELNLESQAALLRALQPEVDSTPTLRKFSRLGGHDEITSCVRLICATNKNLEEMMLSGKFREDLFHRINECVIHLPTLRERGEDIPKIAKSLLSSINSSLRSNASYTNKKLSHESLQLLKQIDIPGNIRGLRSLLLKTALSFDEEVITPQHVFAVHGMNSNRSKEQSNYQRNLPLNISLETDIFHKTLISSALDQASGNLSKAAGLLGISRQRLSHRMSKLGIKPERTI